MIIREIIMWLSIMRHNLKDFPEVGSDNKIKALNEAIDIIHKYQLMQADYNARLKADMVAMLTDMKDELKHCEITGLWKANYQEGFNDGVSKSLDAIQQKINELKENKDGIHNS